MAGTGHPYEIVNMADVRDVVEALVEQSSGAGAVWFRSKKFLKYLTSAGFTVPVTADMEDVVDEKADAEERDRLVVKLSEGGNLRLFSRQIFELSGPDFDHVGHWLHWLREHDRRLFGKITKIPVEEAVKRSRIWLVSASRVMPADPGKQELFLRTSAGNAWYELLDAAALEAEGTALNHCVGIEMFKDRLRKGQARYLSLKNSDGRPMVTVELAQWKDGNRLLQARAHSNHPVPSILQDCLAELLNSLDADGEDACKAAGLCRNRDGKWSPIVKVWDPLRWQGFKGFAKDDSLIVMSPRNPGTTLCMVTFYRHDWRNQPAPHGKVSALEYRHFHIDEQRAVARIKNLLEDSDTSFPAPLVFKDHAVVPKIDVLEKRRAGEVDYFVEPVPELGGRTADIFLVPHSSDHARIIMKIGKGTHLPATKMDRTSLVVALPQAIRWNAKEATRCLQVVNTVGVDCFSSDEISESKFRSMFDPEKDSGGNWFFFKQEAESCAAMTGIDGEWQFARSVVKFRSQKHLLQLKANADKEIGWLNAVLPDRELEDEIAAFLNKLGLKPSPGAIGGSLRVHNVRGSWFTSSDAEELVRKAAKLQGRRTKYVFTPGEAETVIRFLPAEHLSDLGDKVLAAALSAWAKKAFQYKGYCVPNKTRAYGTWPKHADEWSATWEGRIEVCRRLEGLLDRSALKSLPRITREVFKFMLPKRGRMLWNEAAAARFMLRHHKVIDDGLLRRGIKKTMRYSSALTATGENAPSTLWFGEFRERIEALGLASFLRDAASWELVSLKPETILTLDEAKAWNMCLAYAAGAWFPWRAARSVQTYAGILSRSADAAGVSPEWGKLLSEVAVIESGLRQREPSYFTEMEPMAA